MDARKFARRVIQRASVPTSGGIVTVWTDERIGTVSASGNVETASKVIKIVIVRPKEAADER